MHRYFLNIKSVLATSNIIESFKIIREKVGNIDGHIRVKCNLVNTDILEFSLYVKKAATYYAIENYAYHWQKSDGTLRCRWDNTPHQPELETFPHHVHIDDECNVKPSREIDISAVLKLIQQELNLE